MANLPFSQNQVLPRLKDLLDTLKRDIFLTFNCHALATIQEFECPTVLNGVSYPHATVQATINYTRTVTDQTGTQSQLNYPVLVNIPVISLCGGSTNLTMPIAVGDQALILFNDRDIDNWFTGARSGQLNSGRLHTFSDGIALVGLNTLSSYDTVRALLSNGTVKLGVNPQTNKVTLENGTSLNDILTDLTGILSDLMTLLTTAFATPAVPASPLFPGWAAGAAPINSAISSATSDIGDLLE